MKIYVFEVENWERDTLKQLERDHELVLLEQPLTPRNATEFSEAELVSTFIYSSVDSEVIEAMPKLKFVSSRSTGVDHVDMEACRQRDIFVCNVPGYGKNTVAEHVFALLLTLSHRMEEAIDRTRKGDFSPKGLQGFDLEGRTLGVVGTGEIGLATVRIARGFGMKVLGNDVQRDEEAAKKLGFRYVELDELLESSDVVSLHVPATEQTQHLISDDEFAKMKRGAVLINTARGSVIDVRAMARALADAHLAGAGLDVLPQEPVVREEAEVLRSVYEQSHDLATLLADHALVRMRNVVVTPHSAFHTREAVQRILDTTVDNIRCWEKGEPQNGKAAA